MAQMATVKNKIFVSTGVEIVSLFTLQNKTYSLLQVTAVNLPDFLKTASAADFERS